MGSKRVGPLAHRPTEQRREKCLEEISHVWESGVLWSWRIDADSYRDPNANDGVGVTAMLYASEQGHERVCQASTKS